MLGSRTKQINAYGKRGKRIIDASGDATRPSAVSTAEIISIFDDLPPPPPRGSVAAKMKKRENVLLSKPKSPLQRVVGLQKKRRLSPVLSPVKKKPLPRVIQLVEEEALRSLYNDTPVKAKPERLLGSPIASPPRPPLSAYTLNVPNSPAISQRLPKKARIPSKGTPSKLNKAFSPFLDVDIIVLDDDGRTISKEHRVSKPAVNKKPTNGKSKLKTALISIPSETDEEEPSQPLRPKRQAARRKAVIVSDDDDSDDDEPLPAKPMLKVNNDSHVSRPSRRMVSSKPTQRVEVVIPPAPYKIQPIIAQPMAPPPPSTSDSDDDEPSLPQLSQNSIQQELSRYQPVSSPVLKGRPLTPIKGGGRRRIFDPPSPPSPTTPTDLDFSLDFAELNLDTSTSQEVHEAAFNAPTYLKDLLDECRQEHSGPHNFSAFIESFPFDAIMESARERGADMKFRKVGEASYSEVFGIGDVVLKVIPLRDETSSSNVEEDGPAPSEAKDVRKEIVVTRALGEVYSGFVKLLKTYVVRGRYPEVLLRLWDEYNEQRGSESIRPDMFKVSQIYAIIVLPNGGPDLEAFTFSTPSRNGWKQASCIFWQVAKSLAHAETLVSFEHRDLHWGQILVKSTPSALKSLNINREGRSKAQRSYMDDPSVGIRTTIIDLGLSRMDAGDGAGGNAVHWTPFDEEVFEGEGDYQFEIYRLMKKATGQKWDGYHPVTNVLWLHYLLKKLISSKGLKLPPPVRKPKGLEATQIARPSEVMFTEKDCYDCLMDVEKWLSEFIAGIISKPKEITKGRGRPSKKSPTPVTSVPGPTCAGEIVAYGVKMGWIKGSISQ